MFCCPSARTDPDLPDDSAPSVVQATSRVVRGEPFVLIDDRPEATTGYLVVGAESADAQTLNFMAAHGRGLICLAITAERARHLGLRPMTVVGGQPRRPEFTVSIEARSGVTTGISAADRARTVAVAMNPEARAEDLVSPGHVFPLIARPGGVLERAEPAEAALDVVRSAGRRAGAVLCEILDEDGAVASGPELESFIRRHGLAACAISEIVDHQRRVAGRVELISERRLDLGAAGEWRAMVFLDNLWGGEHLLLTRRELRDLAPEQVAIRSADLVDDLIGRCERRSVLELIADAGSTDGRDALLLVQPLFRPSLSARLAGQSRAEEDRAAALIGELVKGAIARSARPAAKACA